MNFWVPIGRRIGCVAVYRGEPRLCLANSFIESQDCLFFADGFWDRHGRWRVFLHDRIKARIVWFIAIVAEV